MTTMVTDMAINLVMGWAFMMSPLVLLTGLLTWLLLDLKKALLVMMGTWAFIFTCGICVYYGIFLLHTTTGGAA